MKHTIRHRSTGILIYEGDHETFRDAVIAAVAAGTDLTGANLKDADLEGAQLTGANLRGAQLAERVDPMTRCVYQFGLRPPTENEALIRAQLRAAHEYRNDLIAIERGRRWALREVDDASTDVLEAANVVRQATRSTRKAARTALRTARIKARQEHATELTAISERESDLRIGARALTACFWGSYLDIEAAHNQARSAPLYGEDALTPSDPHFAQGPRLGRAAFPPGDPRAVWWLGEGQVGVQLQGGLSTADALRGEDTRVRVVPGPIGPKGYGHHLLYLRVGSEGRAPIWGVWPLKLHRAIPTTALWKWVRPLKLHRAIPTTALWKWVRVSLRVEGTHEYWSVEITVDDAAEHPHARDVTLRHAVAVEWAWEPLSNPSNEGSIRVARWADTHGETGEILLPAHTVAGIRKPDGIRARRDLYLNEMRPRLARAVHDAKDLPSWIRDASATLHLWRSPDRFRELAFRWRREAPSVAPQALDILNVWLKRDDHLHDYEDCSRRQALRRRCWIYRQIAAEWSRRYRTVLLSDQDLSKEARWGEASDLRTTASPFELRSCLRNAFGEECTVNASWKLPPPVGLGADAQQPWCERVRDAWNAGGARGDGIFAELKGKVLNAWAARKAKKTAAIVATKGL